jgi:predicted amidohydrolase YtcJ
MKSRRIFSIFICLLFTLIACASPEAVRMAGSTNTTSMILPSPSPSPEPVPIEPADIIFYNGNIITIEKDQPLAQALAVHGQLIEAVGDNDEILALQGPGTQMIDLQSRTVMPGFIDSHIHFTRNRWEMGDSIDEIMDVMLSLGLTTVTEMTSTDEFINFMLNTEQVGQLRMRFNIVGEYNCGFLDENGNSIECTSWYQDNPPILDPASQVRVPIVKIFMDGAGTPARGCPYYTEPFADTIMQFYPEITESCRTPRGDLYLTEEQLTSVLEDIQTRGYGAALHVMGDASLDVTLNAIETALDGTSNLLVRHQIQHNSLVRLDQEQRYVQLNILAGMAGQFNTCDANDYVIMFGEERAAWNGDRYDLPLLGLHVSYQSDFNGKNLTDPPNYDGFNPIYGLFGLVTHKQIAPDGSYCDPPDWLSRNTAPVERALEMMTIESAYMVSMEDFIGSLKPGKFADMVILSGDPLTIDSDDIPSITVLMTMVAGVRRYCAEGQDAICPSEIEIDPITPVGDKDKTAQVGFDCDVHKNSPVHVNSQDYVQTTIDWAALTVAEVDDFIGNVHYVLYVNGQPVDTAFNSSTVEALSGNDYYHSLSAFDVGSLAPGKYELRTVLSWDTAITDGQGWYGPNTENPYIIGTCTLIVSE